MAKTTKKDKIKLVWIGDACVASGFAAVTHGVLDHFSKRDWDINVLGVNASGDPHPHQYNIWPAKNGGDIMGFNRIPAMLEYVQPDVVMLFNDLWVVHQYKKILEDANYNGKVACYFPIDSIGYHREWCTNLSKFNKVIVYTKFGEQVIRDGGYQGEVAIIPHGIDKEVFHPVNRTLARASMRGLNIDDFIVLNANRNQARKRIDITIKGFCQFAKKKPEARLYLHMGLKDVGWDIIPLMQRECFRHNLDIAKKLIITNPDLSPRTAPPKEHLNLIYNACDIGINTSLGEGWGLCSFEHSACKVPQIVPDYSACKELYEGKAILLPVKQYLTATGINTEGGLVHEDDVAQALEDYYSNPHIMTQYAEAMYNYMQDPIFDWANVAKRFETELKSIL